MRLMMYVYNPLTSRTESEEIPLSQYSDLHSIVDRYLQLGLRVTLQLEG